MLHFALEFRQDVDSALNFTGTGENGTEITGGFFAGAISTRGSIGGTVAFADVDVTATAGSSNGVIDLTDTSITGTFSITDLDIVTELPADAMGSFDCAGIDLSGTSGGGTVRIGDTVVAGESASIGAGLTVGVLTSDTTNVNFTFGDGEGDTDKGSTIDVDVAISSNPGPAGGTYNSEDVLFDDAAEFDFPAGADGRVVFVAAIATGDQSGDDLSNLANVGTADSVAGEATFVLVNENGLISTNNFGLRLEDGQNIDGFGNNNTITVGTGAPEGFTGVPGSQETFTHNGGAATITGGAGSTIEIAGSTVIQNVNITSTSFTSAAVKTAGTTFTDAEIILRDLSIDQRALNSNTFPRVLELNFSDAETGVEITVRNVDVVGNSLVFREGFWGGAAADVKVGISDSTFTGLGISELALRVRASSNVGVGPHLTITDFSNNLVSGSEWGAGIRIERADFNADGLGAAVQGGNLVIGRDFADRIQGDGIRLDDATGTLNLDSLTVFAEQFGAAPLGVRNNSGAALTLNIGSQNINTFEIP